MSEFFYRFRSIGNLLGDRQELDRQEIFFASPEQLNDPLEGFRDVFWRGDDILWNNLFKNYLRCLVHAITLLTIHGEQEMFGWAQIPVNAPPNGYDFPGLSTMEEEIFDIFFHHPHVAEGLQILSSFTRPVRRHELAAYLIAIHVFACQTIIKIRGKAGLAKSIPVGDAPGLERSLAAFPALARSAASTAAEVDGERKLVVLFEVTRSANLQMRLLNSYSWRTRSSANFSFVFAQFSDEYVDQLDRLAYAPWYAACFMTDIRNSSLWGTYGSNHEGVALKFKPRDDGGRLTLPLHIVNGWSSLNGPIKGEVPLSSIQ